MSRAPRVPAGRSHPDATRTAAGSVAGGAAAAALLAAAALVDPWGLHRFTTLRWTAIAAMIGIAAVALAWGEERPRLPRSFVLVGAGTLAWIGLATSLADDRLTALIGHPRRNLGLLAWAVFAAAAAVGAALPWRERPVGAAITAAGLAVTAGAAADWIGWSPGGVDFAGGRLGGLSGQPAYLGSLALLVGVAAAGVAASAPARTWARRLAAVAAIGCGATLVATQTRGAWLGAVAAAVVALPTVAPAVRRLLTGNRTSAVIVGGSALVAVVTLTPLAGRLTDAADLSAGTSRGRLDEWVVAARVIGDHPVAGVGPEGYRVAAPAAIDEGYAERHGRDEVVDRAHSGPLDVAASAGLPAAVGYVVLGGLVVHAAVVVNRRRPNTLIAGLGAAVVGFFTAQLFLFPVPELDAVAWLAAGTVVAAASRLGHRTTGPTRGAAGIPGITGITAVVAATTLLVVGAAVGGRNVVADRAARAAADAAADGRHADALAAVDRAVGAGIVDIDASYLGAVIARSGPTILDLDDALDRVERGLRGAPGDPALRTLHVDLLVERAARSGLGDDLERARVASADLAAHDPTNPAHLCAAPTLAALAGDAARDGTDRTTAGCTPR